MQNKYTDVVFKGFYDRQTKPSEDRKRQPH